MNEAMIWRPSPASERQEMTVFNALIAMENPTPVGDLASDRRELLPLFVEAPTFL